MSDAARPLISVIVPSYNQGRYLRQCIDSVLAQDYRPVEIIVVDGASTDETLEVLRSYVQMSEVRWVSEPDDGPASAVNKGLALARGEIASIQSSDDFFLPGAFTAAVVAFSDPAIGLAYGEATSASETGEPKFARRRPPHSNALCIALCVGIPQCSAFFRTDLARQLGGWRKNYFTCDWDLWLRMMFRTRVVKMNGVLAAWRVYPGQRTDRRAQVYESFRRMLDESEDIRRGGWRVRCASAAARHLIGVSFGPRRGTLARLSYLAGAVLWYPPIWPWLPQKERLIPGYGLLSRLRQRYLPALSGP